MDQVTVDLSKDEGSQIGRMFVAFSRVRDYRDLRIIAKHEIIWEQMFRDMRLTVSGKKTKKGWSERLNEWIRLENLARKTASIHP